MNTPNVVTRKNVLLLFSKLPEPGLVKTRLTTLKDGIFSPDVASALYHCMLFDVAEICMAAFDTLENNNALEGEDHPTVKDVYELWISVAPEENVTRMQALFENSGEWPRPITYIADHGATFDEHYNDSFSQVWASGADCILSMGADMPALTVADVVAGFKALHKLDDSKTPGIVLAPDQEMGVSVIGWTKDTVFDHSGVFYNQEGLTVLPAYIRKAKAAGIAAKYLPPVPDVDTMADLRHAVTIIEALNYTAQFDGNTPPWRCAQALEEIGWSEIVVLPNGLMDPRGHIDKG
jgi:hypothetical protein